MKPNRNQINWPAVGAFIGIVGFWGTIILCFLLTMCSCSTQKELHEHQTHTIVADTLAKEARHEGHHQQTVADLDSLVTASVWAAMQEYAASQTEHERTTETLTETIDSLGRIVRQQQKITDRTVSRQEMQRQRQQLQQMKTEMQRHLERMDSTWSERLAQVESHLRDSLAQQLDKQSAVNASDGASWWQRSWSWLKGVLIGLAIGIAVMLTRKYWNL